MAQAKFGSLYQTHPRPTFSGILHVRQMVPDVLKGCDAFVFKVKQSKNNYSWTV